EGLRVPIPNGEGDRPLGGHAPGVDPAQQAEVEEAHPTVATQQVVAGVRVTERDAVAIKQPEVEPKDDLAVAVALHLIRSADRLKALSLDVLRHEHAPGRQARVYSRHTDERMSPQQPPDAALVLGLEPVVELLTDPLAHLRGERLRVQARREPLHE